MFFCYFETRRWPDVFVSSEREFKIFVFTTSEKKRVWVSYDYFLRFWVKQIIYFLSFHFIILKFKIIMFSLMEERDLHNPEINHWYLFLNLTVNFSNSELNSIYLVKNFLESEINKLLNTKYDQALNVTILGKNELMIYLITDIKKKRNWDYFLNNILE